MKLLFKFLLVIILTLALMALFCALPTNPKDDPGNSDIRLFSSSTSIVSSGASTRIGLEIKYPEHFKAINISSSCGDYSDTLSPDGLLLIDTVYFDAKFINEGACTIFVAASYKDQRFKDKISQLPLYIIAGKPTINFNSIPSSFSTHTGKIDTLLFVVTKGKLLSPEFKVTSSPLLSEQELAMIKGTSGDTVRVIFNPSVADTYTVYLHAEAKLSTPDEVIGDSACVGIKVYKAIAPTLANVPQNILAGTTDTLIFAVDNTGRPDPLSLNLLNKATLDSTIVRIIKASSDSLIIAVTPSTAGPIDIAIRLSNGVVSDTMRYRIDCIKAETALWNKALVIFEAIEGQKVRHNLKQYFVKPLTGQVSFASDIGSVTADTVWEWTPDWGSAATVVATITAQKGDSVQKLQLTVTVSPGDSSKPSVRLADATLSGKKVGSSQITVDCIVKDSGAGTKKVTMLHNGQAVEAVGKNDTVFSGVISGLKHNVPEVITLSATDSSMKKNTGLFLFTITFDSTVGDAEAPTFTYVSGPKSGDRVKIAQDTIVYSILDNSGVDSVWWTFNGKPAGVAIKRTDSTYLLTYSQLSFGANKIQLFAQDKSTNKNSGSVEITLNFNTEITTVSSLTPLNESTGVGTKPNFTWNGGDDADGSPVYYIVKYGAAAGNLTGLTPERTEKSVSIDSVSTLSPNTKYYWMVIAYSKVNKDSAKSEVQSFTTAGVGPVITRQPDSLSVSVDGTITLSVVATGNPECSYQWQKEDADLQGKTSSTLSITPAKLEDAGIYRCVVSNSAGSINSNEVAVKVVPTYSLTVNRSPDVGGTVTKVKDTTMYPAGSTVTLTAAALTGYRFDGWTGDTTVSGNVLVLVMNKNRVVIANFKRQYTLTMTSSASVKGSVTPSGSMAVDSGKTYSISAAANSGYKFKKWSKTNVGVVFGDSLVPSTSVTLTNGDATVQGVFGCVTFKKKLQLSQYTDLSLNDAIQTEDGGYLVVGIGSSNGLLIKLNSNGDTVCTKTFYSTNVSSIQKASTGYVVTGSTSSEGYNNIQLTCFAQNGNELWSYMYGNNPDQYYFGNMTKLTKDNGYLVGATNNNKIQLIKTDANRNMSWEKTFDDDTYGLSDFQQTSDGYLLVGNVGQGFGQFVIKTDAQGSRLWKTSFNSYFSDGYPGGLRSIALTSDGDFVTCGSGKKNSEDLGYFVKMSQNDTNQIRFLKFYSDAIYLRSVQPTDGGYFFVGSTRTLGNGGFDIYVAKTNATGEIIKQSTYGTIDDEQGLSLKLTSDGGCVVIGSPNWVIKTDENGNVD